MFIWHYNLIWTQWNKEMLKVSEELHCTWWKISFNLFINLFFLHSYSILLQQQHCRQRRRFAKCTENFFAIKVTQNRWKIKKRNEQENKKKIETKTEHKHLCWILFNVWKVLQNNVFHQTKLLKLSCLNNTNLIIRKSIKDFIMCNTQGMGY